MVWWCVDVALITFFIHVGVVYVRIVEVIDDLGGNIVPVVW
jgi:hypothetical protein